MEISQENHANDPNSYIRERIWKAGRSLHPPSIASRSLDSESNYSSDVESDAGSIMVIQAPIAERRANFVAIGELSPSSPSSSSSNNNTTTTNNSNIFISNNNNNFNYNPLVNRVAEMKEYDYAISSRTSTPLSATSTLASEILSKAFMSDTDSQHACSNPPSPIEIDRHEWNSSKSSYGVMNREKDGYDTDESIGMRPGEKSLGRARRKHKNKISSNKKPVQSNNWTSWIYNFMENISGNSW